MIFITFFFYILLHTKCEIQLLLFCSVIINNYIFLSYSNLFCETITFLFWENDLRYCWLWFKKEIKKKKIWCLRFQHVLQLRVIFYLLMTKMYPDVMDFRYSNTVFLVYKLKLYNFNLRHDFEIRRYKIKVSRHYMQF